MEVSDKSDGPTFTTRKSTIGERVAIAMTYDGRRGDWADDMTEFGKAWWLAKARFAIAEMQRIVQERQK